MRSRTPHSKNLNYEFEELKQEKSKLENTIQMNKLSFLEEKSFLESEMKRAEEEAVDAKMKYAQVSMDKDYFQLKFLRLNKEIKKRNIDIKV